MSTGDYGRIIVLGFTFQIIGNTINSAIRTDGSPRYAMLAMMIGGWLPLATPIPIENASILTFIHKPKVVRGISAP